MGRDNNNFSLTETGTPGELRLTFNPTGEDPDRLLIDAIKRLAGCTKVEGPVSGHAVIITLRPGMTSDQEDKLCQQIRPLAEQFCARIGA
jgi:hypothetical protein